MRAYERLLKYVVIHTTSDPDVQGKQPSTDRQFVLANKLVAEMREIGLEGAGVDEKCYVYGWLPASPGCEKLPAIGLIAHMDTSPDSSGENVKPIVHKNYDGGNLALPSGHVIKTELFPDLINMKGETLITASGDTLLGADDKAGIAEILTVCEGIIAQGMPHPRLCIGFTPDEEVGAGADGFDVEHFGATYAYTIDGGDVGEIEYESFNAAGARVHFKGMSVHPGTAKGRMINASKLAIEFAGLLPADECPEKTEDREGFYHLMSMNCHVENAELNYLIRDHDSAAFLQRKEKMQEAIKLIEEKYGAGSAVLEMKDNYYNMGEIIEKHFHLVENAKDATVECGVKPVIMPIRGGTDGSRLSFMGLPCPNLGTGGFYFHGPNECITAERMDKAVDIIMAVIKKYAVAF